MCGGKWGCAARAIEDTIAREASLGQQLEWALGSRTQPLLGHGHQHSQKELECFHSPMSSCPDTRHLGEEADHWLSTG